MGKWDQTQMGSDGLGQIATRFRLFSPVGVRPVPLKAHDFKVFRPDFIGKTEMGD